MLKSEVIKAMADKMTHLPVRTVEDSVNLILALMSQAIINGQRVEIRDFGVFSIREMRQRPAHNPKTGEKMIAPPRRKVHFKQGLKLKTRLIDSMERVDIEEKET